MPESRAIPPFSHLTSLVRLFARWVPLSCCAGVLGGSASALLLWSLDVATAVRERHVWIIALLPLAGFLVGCMYHYFGTAVEAGNNLVLDEIHEPQRTIPVRMTPLTLVGTFLTHLFGGSAGREGTAIQTGASLADQLSRPFRLEPRGRRILLMAGMSAGFSSVFGTPVAGAVFGLEVLAIGSLSYEAVIPCVLAAFIGDFTARVWGVHHTVYRVSAVPDMSLRGLLCAVVAGVVFGLTATLFARLTHWVGSRFKQCFAWSPLRPLFGGIVVALAVLAAGTTKYIGLGIPTIVASFSGTLPPYDFAVKLVFTAITLGAGFKGGEVTPLFFIGATLGNALGYILPLPTPLLAGMGFVAVFAGAANTPIASTIMAMELFGSEAGAYAAIACVVSYAVSGESGIYHSQRCGTPKLGLSLAEQAKVGPLEE